MRCKTIQIKTWYLMMTLLLLTVIAKAEIKWVDVGVNGLTCSLCTRSIENRIKRLGFVDKVVMDLETTNGRVHLKPGSIPSLSAIAKAVVEAGFSVEYIKVTFDLSNVDINSQGAFKDESHSFQWLDYKGNDQQKEKILRIVSDGFLPKKEAQKYKQKIQLQGNDSYLTLYAIEER